MSQYRPTMLVIVLIVQSTTFSACLLGETKVAEGERKSLTPLSHFYNSENGAMKASIWSCAKCAKPPCPGLIDPAPRGWGKTFGGCATLTAGLGCWAAALRFEFLPLLRSAEVLWSVRGLTQKQYPPPPSSTTAMFLMGIFRRALLPSTTKGPTFPSVPCNLQHRCSTLSATTQRLCLQLRSHVPRDQKGNVMVCLAPRTGALGCLY